MAAFLVMPVAAQAGAWDVFADRCLAPMSEVRAPKVADLPVGGADMAGEHFDADKLALMQTYTAAPDITVVVQPEGGFEYFSCLVIADDDSAKSQWEASEAWLADGLATGAWEQMGGSILGPAYLSTTWREPKLRFVRIADRKSGPRVIFSVTETDLES